MNKLDQIAERVANRNRARSADLLTREQAAAHFAIAPRSFDEHVRPHVPVVRIGRAVRWRPEDLDAFIQASQVPAESPAALPVTPAAVPETPALELAPVVPAPRRKRRTPTAEPADRLAAMFDRYADRYSGR